MVDRGIKKAKVLERNLPDIIPTLQGYLVRYRIVSEDRNRLSHWSPIFLVQPEYTFVSGNTSLGKSLNHVDIVWDSVIIEKDGAYIRKARDYDVWLRWDKGDGGDWIYAERVQQNSATFIIPNTYFIEGIDQSIKPDVLTVELFLKGRPITRGLDFLKVYTIGPEAV
jgi:hypothetical protein